MLCSGQVQPVKGISKSLSVGQVVWAPSTQGLHQYLVFVGWSSNPRKLGIKYCYNRQCALYAVRAPVYASEANDLELKWVTCSHKALVVFFCLSQLLISCCRRLSMLTLVYVIWISLWSFRESPNEDSPVLNLTQSISSAFFPSFRYAIYTTTLVLRLYIDLETLFLLLFCVISDNFCSVISQILDTFSRQSSLRKILFQGKWINSEALAQKRRDGFFAEIACLFSTFQFDTIFFLFV